MASNQQHYEKRFFEAKKELLKDIGAVIDIFLNIHNQCVDVAEKHDVSSDSLKEWVLEQLPITQIREQNEDDYTDEDEDEDE